MMRWLDRITGAVTMYRLVLICLLALVAEALLVSLTGELDYNPLAILAMGAVAVVVSYASNRLFALIFRVRPHSESSFITAMILVLLFMPELVGSQLLAIGLAAFFASASKYLLAIRRRHLLNPAAAGAFIAGLALPANPATWWVATPWLLPVVVVGSFVILHRTRHLLLGLVAIVVATISVVVEQLTFGATIGSAIPTALLSYPIVFFVGFMFSEPLTLPPRRWQQLVEALVVGTLFGVIFDLGVLRSSFQLTLLIGNLLAFLLGQRRGIALEYLGRTALAERSWELSFRPRQPLRFEAGQFIEITLPHSGPDVRGLRRTFSIASAPGDATIRLGVREAVQSSSFKSALLALEPGEVVTATTIGGDFLLPRDPARPLLFVAGGIGITPFISHLEHLESAGRRDLVVIYSASSLEELAYSQRLGELGHTVLLLAPSAPSPLPQNWTYLGKAPLTPEVLASAVPDLRSRAAYASGPPAFVHLVRGMLRRAHAHSVKTDYFTGYTAKPGPGTRSA